MRFGSIYSAELSHLFCCFRDAFKLKTFAAHDSWIGMKGSNGNYVYTDNVEANTENSHWDSGQPDKMTPSCVYAHLSSDDVKLIDYSCTDNMFCFCEMWSLSPSLVDRLLFCTFKYTRLCLLWLILSLLERICNQLIFYSHFQFSSNSKSRMFKVERHAIKLNDNWFSIQRRKYIFRKLKT